MSFAEEIAAMMSERELPLWKSDVCAETGIPPQKMTELLKQEGTTWMQLMHAERVKRYRRLCDDNEQLTLRQKAERLGFITKHRKRSYECWLRNMRERGLLDDGQEASANGRTCNG